MTSKVLNIYIIFARPDEWNNRLEEVLKNVHTVHMLYQVYYQLMKNQKNSNIMLACILEAPRKMTFLWKLKRLVFLFNYSPLPLRAVPLQRLSATRRWRNRHRIRNSSRIPKRKATNLATCRRRRVSDAVTQIGDADRRRGDYQRCRVSDASATIGDSQATISDAFKRIITNIMTWKGQKNGKIRHF